MKICPTCEKGAVARVDGRWFKCNSREKDNELQGKKFLSWKSILRNYRNIFNPVESNFVIVRYSINQCSTFNKIRVNTQAAKRQATITVPYGAKVHLPVIHAFSPFLTFLPQLAAQIHIPTSFILPSTIFPGALLFRVWDTHN